MGSVDHEGCWEEHSRSRRLLTGVVSRVQAGSKLSSVPGDAHVQITSGNGTGKCKFEAWVGSVREGPSMESTGKEPGTCQAELPLFPLGARRRDGPAEIFS